jgi:hypothetical protein
MKGQYSLRIGRQALTAPFSFALFAGILCAGAASPVVGDWQGTAAWFSPENGSRQLQVVIHITQSRDGSFAGTLGFPDMGPDTVPLSVITYKEPAVHFEFQLGGGKKKGGGGDSGGTPGKPAIYDGKMNKDHSQISGDVDPGQGKMALVLKRIN